MKKLWWVLVAVVAIGAGPLIFPDDAAEVSDAISATTAAVAAPDPTDEPEKNEIPDPTETAEVPTTIETEPEPGSEEPEPDQSQVETEGALAADVLLTLEVKGRAPKTGYDRDQFGQRWADIDRNGCDTRNDILDRDLTDKTYKPGTRDCVVLTGTLVSPYTRETISFQRGQDTSSEIQIDHVVALSDAWQKGAQQMSAVDREVFANDPLNLLAVDGRSNAQKGDGDAATWLPSNKPYRCDYVARQVGVKAKYNLWVTSAEKDAILRILSGCPDQTIPAGDANVPVQATPSPAPAEPAPAPAPPAPPASDDVYYANCTEARAAGAAPIYKGQPGYRLQMDGDRDGIACE